MRAYSFVLSIILGLLTLQWRHNEREGVSNHRRLDGLLNRLFRRGSKKTLKLRVTGLCEGNSPVTGEFPSQRASNAKNVSIWWRHHDTKKVGKPVHPQGEWESVCRGACDDRTMLTTPRTQDIWKHSIKLFLPEIYWVRLCTEMTWNHYMSY